MRRVTLLAGLVGVVASAAALAARVDIYVVGASAQRNFWNTDITALAGCGAAPATIKWAGPSVNGFGTPDFSETACAAAGTGGELALPVGTIFAIHYSAELGSVAGVALALGHANQTGPAGGTYPSTAYPKQHVFLQWNAGDCTAATETTSGASTCGGAASPAYGLEAQSVAQCPNGAQGTDAMCGATNSIVVATPDIAVADLEPPKFENSIDWPTQIITDGIGVNTPAFKAFGNPPSASNITAVLGALGLGGGTINGQVFMIGLHTVPGGNPTNLSSASVASIFQGNYTTWSQLPEVGTAGDPGNTAITVCRRDNGSGTQVTSNVTFTGGPECGLLGNAFVEPTVVGTPAAAGSIVLNTTTGKVQSCLNTQAAAIGILGLQGNLPGGANVYTVPTIDGYQANAHNAAVGLYRYFSETWGANVSAANAATAQKMLSDARGNAGLVLFPGKETYNAGNTAQTGFTAATPQGYFSLPIAGNGVGNTAENATANTIVPNALFTDAGEQCSVKVPNNANNP